MVNLMQLLKKLKRIYCQYTQYIGRDAMRYELWMKPTATKNRDVHMHDDLYFISEIYFSVLHFFFSLSYAREC